MIARSESFGSTRSAETATSSAAAGSSLDSGSMLVDRTSRLDDVFGGVQLIGTQSWERSRRFIAVVFAFEFIQMVQYIVSPLWNWPSFAYGHGLWKAFFYGQLQWAFASNGWRWLIGFSYTFVVLIWIEVAIFLYLMIVARAHKNQGKELGFWRSQAVNVLRILMCTFQEFAFLSMLNLLLVPVACDWLGHIIYRSHPLLPADAVTSILTQARKGDYAGRLIYFPQQRCFDHGNRLHAPIMVSTAVAHVALGFFATMRRFSADPFSQDFLSFFNATIAIRIFALRAAIPVIFHVLIGWKPELTSGLLFIAYVLIWWFYFRNPIHNSFAHQLLASALSGFYSLCALLLFFTASFGTIVPWASANTSMFMACGYFAWLGATLVDERRRWNFITICKFARHKTGTPVVGVHEFVDAYEPEHVVRVLLRNRGKTIDSHAEVNSLLEKVLQAARHQFPNSAHVALLTASFHCFYDKNLGLAHSLLEKARRYQGISRMERWAIFVLFREKQAMESSQISGEAMDVQTYVSFNTEFKALAKHHRAAIEASRSFWKLFLRSEIKLRSVLNAFQRIESCMAFCDLSYRTVLERYPRSSKLLRAYSKFLLDVKNDPGTSAKYLTEAEKLEEIAENAAQNYGGTLEGSTRIDELRDAVIIISAEGTIEFTNKLLQSMFGFSSRDALEGKNISCLMTQPFSQQHNSYLRNYAQTGKARILKQVREVVGLHRKGYCFPITIFVNKVNQAGSEGFLGVIKAIPEETGIGRVWLTPAGNVLCVSRGFTDLLGYRPEQVTGRYLGAYSLDAETLSQVLAEVKTTDSVYAGSGATREISFRHCFGGHTRVLCSAYFAGTETTRMNVLIMKPVDDKAGCLVVSDEGIIHFSDSRLCAMLGQEAAALEGKGLDAILPRPMGPLHSAAWLKKRQVAGLDAPCMNERTIPLKGPTGRPVHVVFSPIRPLEGEEPGVGAKPLKSLHHSHSQEVLYAFKVLPSSYDTWMAEQRVSLVLAEPGTITSAAAPPTVATLEFFASELQGQSIATFVDGLEPATCLKALQGLLESGTRSTRALWKAKSGVLPTVLEFERHIEGLAVHVYRVDRLDMTLEVGRHTGVIIDSSDLAHVMFGLTKDELRQCTMQQLLPSAFRQGLQSRPEELLNNRTRRTDISPERPFLSPRITYRATDRAGEVLTLNTIALDEGKEQSFSVYLRAVEERPVSLTSVLMRQPSLKNLLDKTAGSKGPNATRKTPTRTLTTTASMASPAEGSPRAVKRLPPLQLKRTPGAASAPNIASLDGMDDDTGEDAALAPLPTKSLDDAAGDDGNAYEDSDEEMLPRRARSSKAHTPSGTPCEATAAAVPSTPVSVPAPGPGPSRFAKLLMNGGGDEAGRGAGPQALSKGARSLKEALGQVAEGEAYGATAPRGADDEGDDEGEGAFHTGGRRGSAGSLHRIPSPQRRNGTGMAELERFLGPDYKSNGHGTGRASNGHGTGTGQGALMGMELGAGMQAPGAGPGDRDRRASEAYSDHSDGSRSQNSAGASDSLGHGGASVGSSKRYRKILKVVNASRASLAFAKLLLYVRLSLLIFVLVHIGSFVMITMYSMVWKGIGDASSQAVLIPQSVYHSLTFGRSIQAAAANLSWVPYPEAHDSLHAELDTIEQIHQFLYLEVQQANSPQGKELRSFYQKPSIAIEYPMPGNRTGREVLGLWDLTNRFVAAGRNAAFRSLTAGSDLVDDPDWLFFEHVGYKYVGPNYNVAAKMEALRYVRKVRLDIETSINAILLIEICLVLPIATAIILWVVRRVTMFHMQRFSFFLQVSKKDILTIITARTSADELDEDSDDEDGNKNLREQQELAQLAAEAQAAEYGGGKGGKTKNGKVDQRKISDPRRTRKVIRILIPALVLGAAAAALLIILHAQVHNEENRAMDVFGISVLDQSAARALFNLQELTYSSLTGTGDVSFVRRELDLANEQMSTGLSTVLYGNVSLGISSRLLQDAKVWRVVFDTGCHRKGMPCDPTDPYYFRTTAGMDVLTRDIQQSITFILRQPPSGITMDNARIHFAFNAITHDLLSAIQDLENAFDKHAAFMAMVQALNGLILGAIVLVAFYYFHKVIKPHFQTFRRESELMAGLLLRVPAHVPIDRMLMEYVMQMRRKGKRSSTGAPPGNAVAPATGAAGALPNGISPDAIAKFMAQLMMAGPGPAEKGASNEGNGTFYPPSAYMNGGR